uniref:CLTH domain-containing protein n=1 Tax=Echinostoma caproni TaxID=27848 RepID=A0A183BAA9_9TREM
LLAYPSPAADNCPLRGLLDPVWRDTIASVINSAVLKAHDLPVQPALEQGLRALQRCFQDQYFVEAQTLGHFLLYHLTPSQVDAAEQAAASSVLNNLSVGGVGPGCTDHSKTDAGSSPPSSSSMDERLSSTTKSRVGGSSTTRRAGVLNGHNSEPRRRSVRRGRADDPHAQVLNTPLQPSSSLSPYPSSRSGSGSLRNQLSTTNPVPRFRPQSAAATVVSPRTSGSNNSNITCLSDPDGTTNSPPNLDSAFHGLVSLSYPHHTEFLAAMNDALKAYAGSILLTDDDQSASCSLTAPSSRISRSGGSGAGGGGAASGPPPSSGGGTCAP